tara:strand:- start:1161 stop:1391 length:231 start_codon:yes stop_codon:yes gene_type:complete
MKEIKEKVHKLARMLKKVGITHQELSEFVGIRRSKVTEAMHVDSIVKVWDGAESLINQRIKELNAWEQSEKTPNCY